MTKSFPLFSSFYDFAHGNSSEELAGRNEAETQCWQTAETWSQTGLDCISKSVIEGNTGQVNSSFMSFKFFIHNMNMTLSFSNVVVTEQKNNMPSKVSGIYKVVNKC